MWTCCHWLFLLIRRNLSGDGPSLIMTCQVAYIEFGSEVWFPNNTVICTNKCSPEISSAFLSQPLSCNCWIEYTITSFCKNRSCFKTKLFCGGHLQLRLQCAAVFGTIQIYFVILSFCHFKNYDNFFNVHIKESFQKMHTKQNFTLSIKFTVLNFRLL